MYIYIYIYSYIHSDHLREDQGEDGQRAVDEDGLGGTENPRCHITTDIILCYCYYYYVITGVYYYVITGVILLCYCYY